MAQYAPLREYLAEQAAQGTVTLELSFADIEALTGELPPSAHKYKAWWAGGSHVAARVWQVAGWRVRSVDQTATRVVFERVELAADKSIPLRALAVEPTTGFPEAEVQAFVVEHLKRSGWRIERTADTATKEQGTDVVASREGRTVAIEVKGYPGTGYADPARAAERKATHPATQARHWYAQALLKAMLMRDDHPTYEVVIALPDVGTYRTLHKRTMGSLSAVQVAVWFINRDGWVVS